MLRAGWRWLARIVAISVFALPAVNAVADSDLTLRVRGAGVTSEQVYDADGLARLGSTTIVTKTPWTGNREIRFVGVPLGAVLAAAGAKGETVNAVALNDYAVTFSAADVEGKGALIAFEMDGKRLSVRDKGPFWIVFPWSARPELDTSTVASFSIWQLAELDIR